MDLNYAHAKYFNFSLESYLCQYQEKQLLHGLALLLVY